MRIGNDVKQAFDMWGRLLNDLHTDLTRAVGYWNHPVMHSYAHELMTYNIRKLETIMEQMKIAPTDQPFYSIVEVITGYGSDDVYYVPVSRFAEFIRGIDSYGCCAFCKGEDWDNPNTFIGDWFKRHPTADTCPVCQGRAT